MGDAMNETYGGPSAEFCCNLKNLKLKKNHGKPSIGASDVGDREHDANNELKVDIVEEVSIEVVDRKHDEKDELEGNSAREVSIEFRDKEQNANEDLAGGNAREVSIEVTK
ncbi:hypothetical protein FCV25MIE_15599 [Fagus crenata]